MRARIKTDHKGSFTDLKQGVKEAIGEEVENCLRMWGSAGRAAEVLTQCAPWASVEHMIIFNVERMNNEQAQSMMAEGRRVLSRIPGVREVFTGQALQEGTKYKFCWLVRFTDKAVISSYREHPDHIAFFDQLFSPFAGERMSIDFQDSVSAAQKSILPLTDPNGITINKIMPVTIN